MSYGHADKIAAIVAGAQAAADTPPIDPRLFEHPDVRRVLAERDIGGLYRALNDAGVPQRRIAELTRQSQSEVSEIIKGRRVLAYNTLVKIAEGLGIPRERMGLSYGEHSAYGGQGTVADPPQGVDTEMLRRRLIALGAAVAVGAPAAKLAPLLERLELPDPSPVPLPSRLSGVHVAQVRDLTRRLADAGRAYGSDPEVSTATAVRAMRLLDVPGAEAVKRALLVAVAELHLHAGWAGLDAGLYDRAMFHYGRALELGTQAGDAYCQALALNYAGLATVEHGDPNEGLKLLQCGGVTASDIPVDAQRPVTGVAFHRDAVRACASADSATALADLDEPEKANTALARARELWQPTNEDRSGDLDTPAAHLELDRGRLDAAEPFAVASVRRWEGVSERARTQAATVLATIHVRAGESAGLRLAHGAVVAAARLTSVRARKRLVPLAAALEARRGGDHRELARMARQVATVRV